ncbi:hypothetical protein F2P81_006718 [Scophthalmus maximus]|uniref:Uncharacterized protein n=1 Tax=Scophthalmus maximus TaxID=52904 RepID=A0A6A4TAC6_SCOMX|nr:hypothetical protein F2P81_006718 [Scophthalmus maximus]
MLTLAEQCLERARSFVEEKKKSADPPDLSASDPPDLSASDPPDISASAPASSGAHRTTVLPLAIAAHTEQREGTDPTATSELSPFLPPEIFQRLQTEESRDATKKELTPIEQASRLNQKLKANYEARLARLAPGQASQKTSLMRTMLRRQVELRAHWRKLKAFVKKLSLQRQMMENLIIAKARQDAVSFCRQLVSLLVDW